MGMVEDLFTRPAHRGRGLATAIIAHAIAYARSYGMGSMLIAPHVTEKPKALYAALGFAPRCIIRQFLLETAANGRSS